MSEATNHDEALRLLAEAEHNPAADRLIHLAQARAVLALVEEMRALRETIGALTDRTIGR